MSDLVENILKEIENKNYGLAIELCDKLISHQPNNENIYELKAGCLAALKDYKKAAECYGNAVDTAVMNKIPAADISGLHYKKGKTHLKLSEVENAAREFKAALDYNPDSDRANNDYASCLRKLDLCEEALEFADKAVTLNPNSAEYYNNRGNIYYCLGMSDESVRDYNKAIELNPGYANAYFNRGSIFFESVNDTDRARTDWLRAIELNPEYKNELTQHSEAVRKLIEEKPGEEKPVEEIPVEEIPVEEIPIEEIPIEEKPVEEKPVEEKPVEEKPVEEKPVEEKGKTEDISNIADKITIIPLESINEPAKIHTEENPPNDTTEHERKEENPPEETTELEHTEENKSEEIISDDSSETAKVTDLFPGINETHVSHDSTPPSFSDYSDIFSDEVTGIRETGIHDDFKIPELDFKSIFQETSGTNDNEPPEENQDGKPINIGEIKDLHDEIQKPPEKESVLSGIVPKAGPFEEIYTPRTETPVLVEPERKPWYAHPALWVILIVIVIFSGLLAGYYYLLNLGNDASKFITQADSTLKSLTAAKDSTAPKTTTEEQKKDTAAVTGEKSEKNNEQKKDENTETKKEEPKQTESKFLGYLSDKQNFALFSEPDGYYVQIGSFKDKAAAYEKLNFLKERNVKGNVFEADLKDKGLLYRVRAGAFESQEKAKEVMQKFE